MTMMEDPGVTNEALRTLLQRAMGGVLAKQLSPKRSRWPRPVR
jgi:hypothetical protein